METDDSPCKVNKSTKVISDILDYNLCRKNSIQPGKATALPGKRRHQYKINVHRVFDSKPLMNQPIRKARTRLSNEFENKVR